MDKEFLYDYQRDAVDKLRCGCVLNGGVGSGKSRTGLYYYFKENGGSIVGGDYTPMSDPVDLYIITTAMKRNKLEWQEELLPYRLSPDPELNYYDNKVVIDSWNNIKKYVDVKGAFFIFDESHLTGWGTWSKAFLKITRNNNEWIVLSATPADSWIEYCTLFIANGFYKNKSEFIDEHVIYSRFSKYPKIERYVNTGRLLRLKSQILIDMDFQRQTIRHHEDIYCSYNTEMYKQVMKTRWNPYEFEPISQPSVLCSVLRRIVNTDLSRQTALLKILKNTPKAIIFYNFHYELEILLNLPYEEGVKVAQYNGNIHEPIPDTEKWVYLVQYQCCEGWNCIDTDTVIFYSQSYSYKQFEQACGRIDRVTTSYRNLRYYNLKSRSGIDLAISKALNQKKNFNEARWVGW